MANMGYVMFENTLGDLQECYDALLEGKKLSDEEKKARKKLVELCVTIAEEFGDED
jgi:hypothetical protein